MGRTIYADRLQAARRAYADRGRELVEAGYYQVSRKYGIVARLPAGLTGREALAQHWRGAERLTEGGAGNLYLRVYAPPADQLTLAPAEFIAFRRAGGRDYVQGPYPGVSR